MCERLGPAHGSETGGGEVWRKNDRGGKRDSGQQKAGKVESSDKNEETADGRKERDDG
jgi:hypothetical protein